MGVRSTAILFGNWIRPLLMLCGAGFVSMLGFAGYLNNQGRAYFILSVGGTALHVIWQFLTVDLEVPASCWSELHYFVILATWLTLCCVLGNFNRNGQLGWIVWGGLFVDYLNSSGVI